MSSRNTHTHTTWALKCSENARQCCPPLHVAPHDHATIYKRGLPRTVTAPQIWHPLALQFLDFQKFYVHFRQMGLLLGGIPLRDPHACKSCKSPPAHERPEERSKLLVSSRVTFSPTLSSPSPSASLLLLMWASCLPPPPIPLLQTAHCGCVLGLMYSAFQTFVQAHHMMLI
ncbi:hypothetical protein KC19_1G030700 [Ceratodon purpureus]|uniref:Uncharacterized protein n=1 Tax=Ceratodon purpureus TaxID=3225 RepID=A0A8T0J2X7_CERPU|nr:hypothetical protein KC19_1G030700 [Ceratodon purpureus]